MPDDFLAQVAVDKPINEPFPIRQTQGLETGVRTEADVAATYGLTLKNKDHTAQARIGTKVMLLAGQTTNLTGGTAKVVVTQLVNEMMQRAGMSIKLADPNARLEFEAQIIKGQSTLQELMGNANFVSERQQINDAMDNLNRGTTDEPIPFPTEIGTASRTAPETDSGAGVPKTDAQPNRGGRPRKTS